MFDAHVAGALRQAPHDSKSSLTAVATSDIAPPRDGVELWESALYDDGDYDGVEAGIQTYSSESRFWSKSRMYWAACEWTETAGKVSDNVFFSKYANFRSPFIVSHLLCLRQLLHFNYAWSMPIRWQASNFWDPWKLTLNRAVLRSFPPN